MITQELRDAWTRLDQARTVAWRNWKKHFRTLKDNGADFDRCLRESTDMLHWELQPYYDTVSKLEVS